MRKNNFVVLFDLDYTIWDHVPLSRQSIDMAKYLKIPYSDCFQRQIIDFWNSDLLQDIIITKSSAGIIAEKGIPYLREHGAKGVDFLSSMSDTDTVWLNNGAKELLSFLKSNNYTTIAYSDWFLEYQSLLMKRLNIKEYFDEIYTWDGTYQKPNKERIQSLVARFPNKRFVYVGDSLHRDMESACHIKDCISIWYTKSYKENDLNISYHVDDLSKIIDILKSTL